MVSFKLFLIFSFHLLLFLQPSRSLERYTKWCGKVPIRFPFQIISTSPPQNPFGFPGFTVTCQNETQNILNFPYSGDFRISNINYFSQTISINDPSDCTAKRLLKGFNYSGTPFQPLYTQNFTFLNCTIDAPIFLDAISPIPCLSGENYSVVALPTDRYNLSNRLNCLKIATVLYPTSIPGYLSNSIEDYITLTWKEPDCQWCEGMEGNCQFIDDTSLEVGCFELSDYYGILSTPKYTAAIVFASSLSIFGFIICIGRKINNTNVEISNSTSTLVRKGLDRPTIEMYPTMSLGESLELPNPNDNTCSICLIEYQAKDTLRTIPNCMHYFHVGCIDEWLKRKATCPLCRNI